MARIDPEGALGRPRALHRPLPDARREDPGRGRPGGRLVLLREGRAEDHRRRLGRLWKRGCFGWEYKRKRDNLDEALTQLRRYAPALENPPLLIVCDTDLIRIHTNFTYTVERIHRISLGDLEIAEKRDLLK